MPAVVFFSHIPTLRLAEDVPFAGGELTRLPWDSYDMLSQGAFSDFQRLYEETAPVFYRVDAPGLSADPVATARAPVAPPARPPDRRSGCSRLR